MSPSKSEIRALFKKKRLQLSEEELRKASQKIAALVEKFCEGYSELDHFHLFFPIKKQREVDTFLIRDFLVDRKKIIYTSYINLDTNEMETLLVEKQTEFEEDQFGIPTPKVLNPVSSGQIQVVFIPLLVIDQFGNRIGYGKGHYDRFLAKLDSKVLKIGLSIFEPIPIIPKESFDIPLDYCITPKNIINFYL